MGSPALRDPVLPLRGAHPRPDPLRPRRGRRDLRRAHGLRPGGREEARRLFFGLAPRVLRDGRVLVQHPGPRGLDLHDALARPHDERPGNLRQSACSTRAPPHPQAVGLRRSVGADAGLRRDVPHHHAGLGRPARPVGFRRRVPVAGRRLRRGPRDPGDRRSSRFRRRSRRSPRRASSWPRFTSSPCSSG